MFVARLLLQPPIVVKATTTTSAASASVVLYSNGATVYGRLIDEAGVPLAGRTMTVERKQAGATSFTGLNVAATDANGNWSTGTGGVGTNTDYRARCAGDTGTSASVSGTVRVNAQVAVSNSTATTDVKLGNARSSLSELIVSGVRGSPLERLRMAPIARGIEKRYKAVMIHNDGRSVGLDLGPVKPLGGGWDVRLVCDRRDKLQMPR